MSTDLKIYSDCVPRATFDLGVQMAESEGRNQGLLEAIKLCLKQAVSWESVATSPLKELAQERALAAHQLAGVIRSHISASVLHDYLSDLPDGPCAICGKERLWQLHVEDYDDNE